MARRMKKLGYGGTYYESNRTPEDDAKYVVCFGKYKGTPLLTVAEQHPKYIVWACENTETAFCSPSLYKKCREVVDAEWELKNRPRLQREMNKQVRETMARLHASGTPVYDYPDYDSTTGKLGRAVRVMPP